jgi:hypothetical protein
MPSNKAHMPVSISIYDVAIYRNRNWIYRPGPGPHAPRPGLRPSALLDAIPSGSCLLICCFWNTDNLKLVLLSTRHTDNPKRAIALQLGKWWGVSMDDGLLRQVLYITSARWLALASPGGLGGDNKETHDRPGHCSHADMLDAPPSPTRRRSRLVGVGPLGGLEPPAWPALLAALLHPRRAVDGQAAGVPALGLEWHAHLR